MAELHNQLLFNHKCFANMVNLIDSIIYCSITDILIYKNIYQESLLASPNKFDKEFAPKLYKNSNFVAFIIYLEFEICKKHHKIYFLL